MDAQDIFRRHFEAQFEPLPVHKTFTKAVEHVPDCLEEASDWDGISEDEEDVVQVVEHRDTEAQTAAMSREELRQFLTSKVPQSATVAVKAKDVVDVEPVDEDIFETANLKKDLALQRLLAESHLLDSAKNPTLHGSNRHKATDLRLQTLGAKTSLLRQEKLPMSHRRGILAKQNERQEKRRMEAKENGIVLERAEMARDGKKSMKRDRGVGNPGVGKFQGGTLRLSKKDIHEIEGPRKRLAGGKRTGTHRKGKIRGS